MSWARLAGVIRLELGGRGPRRGYVFDPHRLALPCWAEALEGQPAVLVTLDRHRDLVPPKEPPPRGLSVQDYDTWARLRLDERNVDFILAGMEAGLVSHAVVFARAAPVGAWLEASWRDSRGEEHGLVVAPLVDRVAAEFGTPQAMPEARRVAGWLDAAAHTLLDVDLDCFTSLSDADPTTVLPWPRSVMRDHLLPRGSEAFWAAVLGKCRALTFAREPGHSGGLLTAGRLFEDAAQVVFGELLGTDLP